VLFSAGDTFLFPLDGSEIAHLWVVATAPDGRGEFAVVSLTSLAGAKDRTVVLQQGEHPFLRHPTCVHYGAAELTSVEKLQENLDCGLAKMRERLRPDVLELVVDGFAASNRTKRRLREYVQERKRAARP
jgi:hypothetical protein